MHNKSQSCSIDSTLSVIGDRWTILILRDLFRGVRRFEQLRQDLGIAKNILSDRLSKLDSAGIIVQRPYQSNPIRNDYYLTERGKDLSPSLIALMHWGDKWYADGNPPTILTHAEVRYGINTNNLMPGADIQVNPSEIASRSSEESPLKATR